MKLTKTDYISIIIILALFVFGFVIYPSMPDKMPIHWNSKGEIDGYGSRFTGVFLFPLIILGLYLLFFYIPKIAVYKKNLDHFMKYFQGMKLIFVLFFTGMYVISLLPNFEINVNMTYFVVPGIAVLFFYIGYILKFAKRNFFIGIRTPWTLSDDKTWDKTHKLGSVTFRINALILLLGLFNPDLMVWVVLVSVLANIVFLFVYSYFVWKKK